MLKAWERVNLPEKFEMGTGHTIAVFRDNLDADRPEQVGSEGHDVAARVKRLGVRVQRDGGRVVQSERMHKCVLQARLMVDLMLQAGGRPRGVIGGRLPEGVVQDQRPAGSAFVVLPQPGRQPVEVQEPRSLLVATKRLRSSSGSGFFEFGCCHFWTLVPGVGATVLKSVAKKVRFGAGPWGRWGVRTKYEGQSTPRRA